MTHRDRMRGPSGRREVADDVAHRQGFPTPSEGPPRRRPERRFTKGIGRCCAGYSMPRIATAHAPGRNPW